MKSWQSLLTAVCAAFTLAACGSGGGNTQTTTPTPTNPTPPPTPVAKKVLVIGAGMAGVKAANKLAAAGLDVIVLEGRDRIGGRTWSDKSMGVSADLGASWIHGVNGKSAD